MPFRTPRNFLPLCLLAPVLASLPGAYADEPAPSLYERRLGILKGTSKGIVVYEPEKPAPPSTSTVTSANGKAEVRADVRVDVPPVATAAPTPAASKFLNSLPPPSGRSMADAQRLGAVNGGIPLTTARSIAQPTAEPAAKP
jgi:hypothetical protein